MKEIIFSDQISFEPNSGSYYPGIPYIVMDDVVAVIKERFKTSGREVTFSINDFTGKNWKYPAPAKTLLIYSSGGIGDQLWLTALVRQIKKLMPSVLVDIVVSGMNWQIWDRNKDIRGVKAEPVLSDVVNHYDGILFFDRIIEKRKDAEQGSCYEILFEEAGIPYAPEFAIPNLSLSHKDEHGAYVLTQNPDTEGKILYTTHHVVLGLHASHRSRNLNWVQYAEVVKAIAQAFPEMKIYGISNNDYGMLIQEKLNALKIPNYIMCHNRISVRNIAALCRTAHLVISPDSMLVHLAATQQTPTVALMTTVPPEKRVSTYPFCVSIYQKENCDYAPCYWKKDSFRQDVAGLVEIAPCYTPSRVMCDVGQTITPQDIIDAAVEAIERKNKNGGYEFKSLPL